MQKDLKSFFALFVADAPETDKKDLLSELEVMKTLKPHPHVIKLLGCVTESGKLLTKILKKSCTFFFFFSVFAHILAKAKVRSRCVLKIGPVMGLANKPFKKKYFQSWTQ